MLVRRSYHYTTGARGRGAEDVLSIGLSQLQMILSLWPWVEIPIAGLGGLTVQVHCPSGYYPQPQSLAQYLQY